MSVELVPGYGIRVSGLPDIPFGLSLAEATELLADYRLRDTWVCRVTWARHLTRAGVEVVLCGDDEGMLGAFQIHRRTLFADVGAEGLAPAETVAYGDIDVFGWPTQDVTDYLNAGGHTGTGDLSLTRGSTEDRFDAAVLRSWTDTVVSGDQQRR